MVFKDRWVCDLERKLNSQTHMRRGLANWGEWARGEGGFEACPINR